MSNSVERNDNFLAKARKLSILSTSSDIFDIRQHYIRSPIQRAHKPRNNISNVRIARRMYWHQQ